MNTSFATSTDGKRIAYDVTGTGPAVMLLHGGDRTRMNWHEVGYVERLMDEFTVITVDIRGHGESDLPTDPIDYTTEKLNQDLLAVADACGVERFTIWGYSYGGNVGRYLATQSDRVAKIIIIGIPFGLGASGALRRWIEDFLAHWTPIVQAERAGTLDLDTLSQNDRGSIQHGNIPANLAWLTAMLDWTAIEPADLPCPTLWLVGSEDENAMSSTKHYEASLTDSNVQPCIMDGLNDTWA